MKALITGAGGFVGANLVRHLLNLGHEPVAVIRPGSNSWRLADAVPEARVEMVDLRRPQDVARVVADVAPDVIFNLAAYGAYSWQTDLNEMLAVNVGATESLLEAARGVGARVIHAGSSSEYGLWDRAPTERDPLRPNSHYAITKAAATHLCQLAAARYEQYAVALRLYSVYGPWEEPGRLMPTLVDRALDGTYPPLVSPDTARDFVWIGDVCDAFIRAASSNVQPPALILNIATGRQTTLRSLVATAGELFDLTAEPEWGTMPQRVWDTAVWVGDPRQAAESTGWRAVTPLSEGLQKLAAWMHVDPQRRMRYRARVSVAA